MFPHNHEGGSVDIFSFPCAVGFLVANAPERLVVVVCCYYRVSCFAERFKGVWAVAEFRSEHETS